MTGQILIADDAAESRDLLLAGLAGSAWRIGIAPRRADALQLAAAGRPDIVLIDLAAPAAEGLALCRALRAGEATGGIGLVLLGGGSDPALRRAGLAAGADEVMDRPPDPAMLRARIRSLMRARSPEAELALRDDTRLALGFADAPAPVDRPGLIAILGAAPQEAAALRSGIAPHLRDRIEILPADGLPSGDAAAPQPDVYVVCADPARPAAALRTIAELRGRPGARHAGILVALPAGDTEAAVTALDLGANDVLAGPVDAMELVLRLRRELRRKSRDDRIRRQLSDGLNLAVTDPLTGLPNRRFALARLTRAAEHAARTGRPFAVLSLDLDRFKRINDGFGHAAGDAVLVEAARRISASLRSVDTVARIGGEEFLVVLPDTGPEAARRAGERLCGLIERAPFALPGGAGAVTMTVSIGVAVGDGRTPSRAGETLLAEADRALYAAKAEGRNQVTLARSAA